MRPYNNQTFFKVNRNALDERPATGLGPTQKVRDAHAIVASACFPPTNQETSKIHIKNQ
jgi:hypothetical protein